MPLSMHQASIPVFVRAFGNLSTILYKAAEFSVANRIDPATLASARLAPDMLTLAGQIQRASDTAKATIARLADVDAAVFADTETTLDDLQERIAKTCAYLHSIDVEQLEGSDERIIQLNFGQFKPALRGDDYLFNFGLPNFFFHIVTAYDILRHSGLAIGKLDFLGRVDLPYASAETS